MSCRSLLRKSMNLIISCRRGGRLAAVQTPEPAPRAPRQAAVVRLLAIALLIAAGHSAPAAALPEGYHYELVSPPDKNDGDVGAGAFRGWFFASPDGNHLAYNATGGFGDAEANAYMGTYAANRGAGNWASTSLLLNVAPASGFTSPMNITVPAVSNDFTKSLTGTSLEQDTGEVSTTPFNGFIYLLDVATREYELFSIPDQSGNKSYLIPNRMLAGNDDFSRIVFTVAADLLNDGLPPTGDRVYVRLPNGTYEHVSVLPNGDPTLGTLPPARLRSVSVDADVAYFNVASGPDAGLYRRDISDGKTSQVNVDEHPDEDPLPASVVFAGASADGGVAYFITTRRLVEDDTDSTSDLYRYNHSNPVGSRLALISEGIGPVQDAHGVSADGETVVFTADSQLYVYSDGEVRHFAPSSLGTAAQTTKLAEDGETFAFVSSAPDITPEDNGGFRQVYVYDVVEDEVFCASCRVAGANVAEATFYELPGVWDNLVDAEAPRRVVSDQGHVFFQTAESLLPQDTNGKTDVYVWQDGDLDLISTGRSTVDSKFADASVDGSTVFFTTREQLSGWDWDNRVDVYAARTGEGLPEPPEPVAPCTGDDCQGPPPLPKPFEVPSSNVEGPGNPDPAPVNCTPAERKADKAAKKAKRLEKQAKRLAKQAKKATGKKAKRLRKQARQAKRKASQARKQARKASDQLALCREEAEL